MDVGATLRTARERRGLQLAQLAATTKIPLGILRAIEDNQFDSVPRGIFVRGYIRAFAREVGLDSTQVIEQFLSENAEAPPAATGTETPLEGSVAQIEQPHIDPEGPGSRPDWGYALIVAALVIGLVSFNRSGESDNTPAGAEAAAVTAGAADTMPDALTAVATSGGALRVEILARGECWVKAVVDGRTVVARLLQPGERVTADATDDVVLRVGDPAAFSYSINGLPGRPLGVAGVPVTVRFTSDGRQAPLAS